MQRAARHEINDFAQARASMLASQVRSSDVTDLRLQHALGSLAREEFVSDGKRSLAYADMQVEALKGRMLLRPRELAKLIQGLALRTGETALEIAGGTGYGTATLALMGAKAALWDDHPDAPEAARKAWNAAGMAGQISVLNADLHANPPEKVDLIVVSGAVEFVPQGWLDALREGGRMGVIVREGALGRARLYTKSGGAAAFRTLFDASPVVLEGFTKKPEFTF